MVLQLAVVRLIRAQIDFSVWELSKNVRFHMEPSLYETSRIVILGAKFGSFAKKW